MATTPRGIRNNNPGNIVFNQRAFDRDPWVDEIGLETGVENPRFTTFRDPVFGIRALAKTLLTYHHHRKAADGSPIDTVQEVIDRWAPPIENNTDAYAFRVRDALNVETGEEIDLDDIEILIPLVGSIIWHENGKCPYFDSELERGVILALAKL